jgi:hypothetical protein
MDRTRWIRAGLEIAAAALGLLVFAPREAFAQG